MKHPDRTGSRTAAVALRYWLALWLAAWVAAPAAQAAKKKPAPPPPDRLRARIEAILSQPDAWRAHWGIKVVSLDRGQAVYSYNEHKFFVPASNTKLFTTALALSTLGPQFRFRTTVEATAPPGKYGRVAGELWLVGRGDPNLSARPLPYRPGVEREGWPLQALDALADQVAARGVRYVDGDLVADDTYFVYERYGEGWAQDDLVWWYGAPVSALSISDNILFLDVLPAERPGERALVRLEPFQDYYRIENRVVTVEAKQQAPRAGSGAEAAKESPARSIAVRREPGSRTLEVWGRIPLDDSGAHEQVAIEDPAEFAGLYLREALLRRGVVIYGKVRARHAYPSEFEDLRKAAAVAGPPRTVLAAYQSVPLGDDLKVINKVSQNLHAEILLRTVARERRGIGSVAAGLEEMREFLDRAGIFQGEYVFYDGSGLSRKNLVTPAAIVALLQYMDGEAVREVWRDLLPVGGVDGTIGERFKETAAAGGRILAKTGTLGHINALSGYLTTVKGERLAFSILLNSHNLPSRQATSLVDQICLALVEGR